MFKAKYTPQDDIFRQLLKDVRIEKKLTQMTLARRLKVPQSYVSKFESGERRLDFVETVFVCDAIGIGIEGFVRAFSRRMAAQKRKKGGPIDEE